MRVKVVMSGLDRDQEQWVLAQMRNRLLHKLLSLFYCHNVPTMSFTLLCNPSLAPGIYLKYGLFALNYNF